MIQKLDKSIIKAYKYMLIDKLGKPEEWSINEREKTGNKYKFGFNYYDTKSYLSLVIRINNTVEIKINSDLLYTFKKMSNLDLIPKINHFRKMKKHEEINKGIRFTERRMRDALPDDYKRAIKISKIKSKI